MKEKNIKHLPYEILESSNINHFYENYWKREALGLLRRYEANLQGWSLLDYGCGRGETLAYAKSLGMEAFGCDTDPECVRLASKHGKTEILDCLHPENQIIEKSYDVVTCFHVLEHVENPKAVLNFLCRTARKYLLVAVPNLQKIPNLRKPFAKPSPCNNGHLQSWDHAHFQNLAENHCGLEIISFANDATRVPVFSELIRRVFGLKATIYFETKIFGRLFPYWGISIIALMKPVK